MKVLCIGSTSYDITCETEGFPVENTKNRYENPVRCGGGTASNAAYLLGKWGVDTTIATVLGSDDYAEIIKKEFASVNVNTSYIETDFENKTPLSFILVNKENGKRTIFNVASERKPLKRSSFEFTPDLIYTDGKDYGSSQSALTKYPGALSVIDAESVTKDILELCKYIKYIVCSKNFAETITSLKFDFNNPSTLVEIYTKLQSKYPKAEIIITLEEQGAMYKENNQIKIMPGLKVDVVDSTGAGDIFHGALTYGILNNFSIEKSVAFANIAGGLSCTKMGGRFSVPSLGEVIEEYNKKGQNIENNMHQQTTNESAQTQLDNSNNVKTSETPTVNVTQEQQNPSAPVEQAIPQAEVVNSESESK